MKDLFIGLRLFLALSILTGILYPLAVTGVAQAAFKSQANGSLITKDGKVLGSRLIGQNFDDPKFFWGRPSATGPVAYNAAASSGSNQGPTNPALKEALEGRIKALKEADSSQKDAVPTELITASGSGLDPHISVEAAMYQVNRVAKANGKTPEEVKTLVQKHTQSPTFGLLGESVVNVLELNLDLAGVLQ